MSRLLNKSVKPFAVFSLLILSISIPFYLLLINNIWREESDEQHQISASKIESKLNLLRDSTAIDEAVKQFNYLRAEGQITRVNTQQVKADSVYSFFRFDPNTNEEEGFRGWTSTLYIHGQPYLFSIETNIEESDETVTAIALVTFSFFLLLLIGFFYLNRRLSKTIWKPFYKTLETLKSFDLSGATDIQLNKTDILEFEELNAAINKLIVRSIAVYKQQKEFTENASHELQTPLAILKSKIDILVQDETLSQEQVEKIAGLNAPLSRASRLNKNLLLLSKIENQRLEDIRETISLRELVDESLGFLNDQIEIRHITVIKDYSGEPLIKASTNLLEIMVLNLLLNAIKHNIEGGNISISLTGDNLTVSNSGLEALKEEALFKRFSSASRTLSGGGSGLGLAIVNEICQRYTWEVRYEFREGLHFFSIHF